jgi:hypothetical protein
LKKSLGLETLKKGRCVCVDDVYVQQFIPMEGVAAKTVMQDTFDLPFPFCM